MLRNQSNIADQLNALTREEDDFRKAAAQADRERAAMEARIRDLRAEQKELSQNTRAASDALGVYQKERGMLLQHKERLQQQLKLERGELEQCVADTKRLVAQCTAAKKKFCNEIEELNDEISDLILQQEELRVQKMLGTSDTVAALTKHLELEPEGDPRLQKKALDSLAATYIKYETALKESKQLSSIIKTLRSRAVADAQLKGQEVRHLWLDDRLWRSIGLTVIYLYLSVIKQLTADSFLQLEVGWAEQDGVDTDQQMQEVPLNVQLFYNDNQNNESQESTVAMEQ